MNTLKATYSINLIHSSLFSGLPATTGASILSLFQQIQNMASIQLLISCTDGFVSQMHLAAQMEVPECLTRC